jgi:transcriptional regulator with XRE-family HTH domain
MSEPRSAPTVGQIVLGKRLQDLREKAGLSPEQAARALRVNQTTVRRMEKAEVGLKLLYVEKLLQTYGVDREETDAFLGLAEEANKPGWWHNFRDVVPDWFSVYVSLEGAAKRIRAYEPHWVPGLLQTEDYVRALMAVGFPDACSEELDRRVALRMERQALLTRPGNAPQLWAVMDEAVLRRNVGGPEVMRGQIESLLEAVERPNVTLQVVPFATGPYLGCSGHFQIFRFQIPELPDIVYAEGLTSAVYMDQREEVSAHLQALDRMCEQAATPEGTAAFLRDLLKEI